MGNKFYKFGGIGLLSGNVNACIYWILSTYAEDFSLMFLFYLAGITYGLITIPLFCIKSGKTIFLWLLTTTASYAGAVQVAVRFSDGGDLGISGPSLISLAYGGFIGAFILALGIYFFIQKFNFFHYFLFMIGGMAIPAVLFSIIGSDRIFIVMLYVAWQTYTTLVMYPILRLRQKLYTENPLRVL